MTAWADIPLTDAVRVAVATAFGIDADGDAERLHGGEESASHRIGDWVIRIGPDWRAGEGGRRVIRVEGRPVTVWPFVPGVWADRDDPEHQAQAADLLARLHRTLEGKRTEPRPIDTSPRLDTPDLEDPDLDEWHAAFLAGASARQPLHGDFYRGNILVNDGRITGLVDWDNAFVGPAPQELAWAAWEWTDASDEYDVDLCAPFLSAYEAAGGPAPLPDEVTTAQVVRHRLRWEVGYGRAARARGVEHDADDLEYEADIIEAFHELKPR
jgi:aminoglycoside phosphotransferase (APT) family kinase protein